MSLSIGIVGLPNAGKSTLFNALTNAGILAANYPFATIDPNTGVVPIPDARLTVLADLFRSKKVVPAAVTFVDIAGLVKGASEGEGLGNQFLANIRDVNAICHVVRAFDSDNVVHVDGVRDPARDISTIETEMAIADLQTIEKRLSRLEKEAKLDKGLASKVAVLRLVHESVGAGEMVSAHPELMSRAGEFADLHLLTAKPVIYVFNSDEELLRDQSKRAKLEDLVAPAAPLFLDAQIEAELSEIPEDERRELLASVGQEEPGLNAVIRAAYDTLGLQSYLTGGEKEVRAWTIPKGATAPQAAGVIHTDFQRGFIAAEVVDFDDLVAAGSWNGARSAGRARTEGKGYVMRPGDVVDFKFNV
ncbi:MAG: redox-regulated ATPase YchF [Acidimicrobiia bacterium]|nr:redox-regulated ATPase YchF [Acidimicrobiia bacterium]MDH3463833.1 redox-regulated ATPase YchF [Acidimicrobiia bacterium]